MSVRPAPLALALWALTTPAWGAPKVATDIPPVHALAARVMAGIGEPALILPPGASPHGHQLRPSEARSLQSAELVFWVGPELEPWMAGALDKLAPEARKVELLEADGVRRLEFRTGATFEAHHHDGDDDAGHDDGDRHDADDNDDAEHDHRGLDPHAWLDPENARAWMDAMAAALGEADPENAAAYRANAEAGKAELAALEREIDAALAPVKGRPYVVFHDAYHYFGARFGVEAAGAISLGDGSAPSPARIAEVQAKAASVGAVCVFAEPQFNPGLVKAVFAEGAVKTAVLDPLGLGLEPGAALYPALLRKLAADLAACLR